MGLEGRTIAITGVARGLGRALVIERSRTDFLT